MMVDLAERFIEDLVSWVMGGEGSDVAGYVFRCCVSYGIVGDDLVIFLFGGRVIVNDWRVSRFDGLRYILRNCLYDKVRGMYSIIDEYGGLVDRLVSYSLLDFFYDSEGCEWGIFSNGWVLSKVFGVNVGCLGNDEVIRHELWRLSEVDMGVLEVWIELCKEYNYYVLLSRCGCEVIRSEGGYVIRKSSVGGVSGILGIDEDEIRVRDVGELKAMMELM